MNQVLNVSGLFEVGTAAGEGEGGGSARIEGKVGIAWIRGNQIAEVFVEKEIVRFETGFPFVTALVDRNRGVEVGLLEIVAQEGSDRPSAVIGVEIGGRIAPHAVNVQ